MCIPAILEVCENVITVGAWSLLYSLDRSHSQRIVTFIRKDRYTAELLRKSSPKKRDFKLMLTPDFLMVSVFGELSGRNSNKYEYFKKIEPNMDMLCYTCKYESMRDIGDHILLCGNVVEVKNTGVDSFLVQSLEDTYDEVKYRRPSK